MTSQPPPEKASHDTNPAPPSSESSLGLHREDLAFVQALRDTGLLPELTGAELERSVIMARMRSSKEGTVSFQIDILEQHYLAGGDTVRARTRTQVDRFFMQRSESWLTASILVEKLSVLTPEVGAIALERIGGPDGTLVLRAGEHFAALLDEYEENLDTGEVDLRDLDADAPQMVTLRALVRAINVLLDRYNVRERLVPLRSDEEREVYIALPLTEAIDLARAGFLEEEQPDAVLEFASW